jgi:hypothetical protein
MTSLCARCAFSLFGAEAVQDCDDRPRYNTPPRSGHTRWALLSREKSADGFHARVLGCGLVPRLSIGTLQLSIRCSSIHFLLSRSFPVSAVGVFKGKVAAFGVGRSSCDLS